MAKPLVCIGHYHLQQLVNKLLYGSFKWSDHKQCTFFCRCYQLETLVPFPDNIGVIQSNYYCVHALIDAVCIYKNWHWAINTETKLVSMSKFTSVFTSCPCSALPLTQLLWYIVTWKFPSPMKHFGDSVSCQLIGQKRNPIFLPVKLPYRRHSSHITSR